MVIACIETNPSPERLDQARSQCLYHQWTDGAPHYSQHALGIAASFGNIPLIGHIVKLGGQQLLSLGNRFGWTPLFQAVLCDKDESVERLLQLGASPNIATSHASAAAPEGATPLWAAAQKTRNVAMAVLLMRCGAVAEPTPDEQGQKVLKEASQQLHKETMDLIDPYLKGDLSVETAGIVADYFGPLPIPTAAQEVTSSMCSLL